ncbi:hypothetical protein J7438_20295 [Thalassotalea sp. G20_0]|uniref:hypothetical protein n=1 Tax=Thalassotalea sp. G20_0 TaxID=2821093 RepID=UPI001ADD2615|nr:hypothetical protein [Thalassotalea sp. G20_0]MBO9496402.1 hypothetical protein [Thalassotalea sp. G20_0]
MPETFIKKPVPCFGHFFYALKPVSLRTAAYVGKYNAMRLYCWGLIAAVRLLFGVRVVLRESF